MCVAATYRAGLARGFAVGRPPDPYATYNPGSQPRWSPGVLHTPLAVAGYGLMCPETASSISRDRYFIHGGASHVLSVLAARLDGTSEKESSRWTPRQIQPPLRRRPS